LNPRDDGKSSHVLEGTVRDWTCFEDKFFSRAYFLAEVQLDPVVLSLIHLDESLEAVNLPGNKTILFDRQAARRRVMTAGREVKNRWKAMHKKKDFDPFKFMVTNNLPLDKICGTFPVVFRDYRRLSHALRMSWAFYLTMKMKKLSDCSFSQRSKEKSFVLKKKNLLTIIFVHIYSQLKSLEISDEKKIVKCLKNSLCYHVSESMDQEELPEGEHFDLVPIPLRSLFGALGKEEKINFFFSLLQSKVLCKEVPEDFILDTLIKHRDQLSTPPPKLQEETLKTLRERGRKFGKVVKQFYDPTHGFNPTNKASFAFPRHSGGVKGNLVYDGRLNNQEHSEDLRSRRLDRMEPLVIGLFGQPGMGKSSALPLLVSALSKLFPGVRREDLTYSRSCNTEHWDGYNYQPITILDDLGQSREGKDIKEFQTLVSCNPYVLPMADLPEKGRLFSSPIIIATSNLQYGHDLNVVFTESSGILDDASFWRRFHVPLHVEHNKLHKLKEDPIWIRHENLIHNYKFSVGFVTDDLTKLYYQRSVKFRQEILENGSIRYKHDAWEPVSNGFLSDIVNLYRQRTSHHDNIRRTWTQVIKSQVETPETQIGKEFYEKEINPFLPTSLGFDSSPEIRSNTYSIEFDAYPPEDPLPVRVEPIVEPLKVRTITAGVADCFCLKPFQRAMWLALGKEQQFCLTHGTNHLEPAIRRIYEKSNPDDVWISGDYTAATDSIPIEASKALLEGILESIDHEPTKRWAMKEISPHLLVYPVESNLDPVLQESGQLMGSLLSFPLLCLLNDCTAQAAGVPPHKYLINGDDILMRAPRSSYPKWKGEVSKFGLSLSLGKNYVHPDFGTVNSQLIHKGEVLNSGKQRVLDRRSEILGECLRDLELMLSETPSDDVKELFKTVNRSKLSRTVRDIGVPVSHGGLALNWGEIKKDVRTKRTNILIYLHDLFRKVEPEKGCLSIPYLSNDCLNQSLIEKMDKQFNEPILVTEYHEDFIGIPQLERVRKRLHSNSTLRDLFLGQNLEDLPSLSFLRTIQVPFNDVKIRKEIQSEIDKLFFLNFLDSNREYGYESFRSSFLEAVKGIQQPSAVATKFLTPIIELQVKPDYLLRVVKDYTVKTFDKELFEKGLGKALQPKQFSLPFIPESPDFSKEVIKSFDTLMEGLKDELDE